MKNTEDYSSIDIIFIAPKSRRYCEYTINNGSIHSKTYEELSEYLCKLFPDLSDDIYKFISLKKYFFVFPQENTIQELKFDYEKEKNEIKKKLLYNSISEVKKEKDGTNRKSLNERSDLFFKKVSDIDVKEKFS